MASPYSEELRKHLTTSVEAKKRLLTDNEQLANFARATEIIVQSYRHGGRLYIAGNGGSAADAQHLAAEFGCKLARVRSPIPAEAMTVDTSLLTSIGNDFSFDEIFARQVDGKMRSVDIFMGITTSGQSPNILRALERCREKDIQSVVLTGRDGGKASELATIAIVAPGDDTSTIQEVHIAIYHTLCSCVESELS